MALPPSGAISFNNINVELGVSGTTQASLGQTSYRTLAGVASGQISMSNFYGKANQFSFTISVNQTNANLASLATAAGWNGSSQLIATIGSGVYVSSSSTGTPGLTVNGSFPGGVSLINNGFIIGMGGAGGRGGGTNAGAAGSAGGLALSVSSAISITNNGTIGGGGGGGGGGAARFLSFYGNNYWGGGGGGGGRTGTVNSAAGGGGPGTVPSDPGFNASGSAGTAGTASSAGSGGSPAVSSGRNPGPGGNGGGWGSSGSSGGSSSGEGSQVNGPYGGGSGGGAVSGNGNITWIATGTRLGSIS
jgi:hypothetical protein